MARKLLIRDLTLRDGQQSQFATRMNQNQVDNIFSLKSYLDRDQYASLGLHHRLENVRGECLRRKKRHQG